MSEIGLGLLALLFFFVVVGIPVLIILSIATHVHKKYSSNHPEKNLVNFSSHSGRLIYYAVNIFFGLLSLWLLYMTPLWKRIDQLPSVTGTIVWIIFGSGMAIVLTTLTLFIVRISK